MPQKIDAMRTEKPDNYMAAIICGMYIQGTTPEMISAIQAVHYEYVVDILENHFKIKIAKLCMTLNNSDNSEPLQNKACGFE
jgi:hypothetical protein